MCNSGAIENEIHFTFKCVTLETTRKTYVPEFLKEIGVEVKKDEYGNDIELDDETCIFAMREMVRGEHVRKFAEWLEMMYLARRSILFR